MRTIDPKTVVEKYDEISHLETRSERIEFLNKQSEDNESCSLAGKYRPKNQRRRIVSRAKRDY